MSAGERHGGAPGAGAPSDGAAVAPRARSILMVGGGVQQVEAVRAVRRAGFRCIVSDRRADAPAFALADERWIVDGLDHGELARRAREARARGLCAAFTLTELVETVARVAAAAELPGVPPEAAALCQDKARAHERWSAAGVPAPRGGVAHDLARARALLAELGGEAFVKPARGFGGRGASAVSSPAELARAFADAAAVATPVLVQELVRGSHHDVNGVFDRAGRFLRAGALDRRFEGALEVEGSAPSGLPPARLDELYGVAERAGRALGVDFGPMKADLVLGEDGFRVLEIAPRLHGPKGTLHLLPLAEGTAPLAAALRVLAGDELDPRELAPARSRAALFRTLVAPPGVLRAIRGLERARALPGVERVDLLVAPGARVAPARDATGAAGHVFATGRDAAEARARARAAAAELAFDVEPDAEPVPGGG